MKKVISLVLLATLSVSVLAGCGKAAVSTSDAGSSSGSTPAATTKKDLTLTVLTNRTDIVDTDLKKMGDDYKTKTGVTIKWEAIKDYEGDVKVRLNSNSYGDVLLLPNGIANSDLPQFFEPLGKNTDDKLKDYNQTDYKAVKNTDGSFTTYGISYGLSASGILYNKAAFKKAGVEKFPTTLKGLYEAAAKLKAAGVVPVATNFNDKWPLQEWDSLAVVESGDGSYMSQKIYKETAPFSADKPHGKALSMLGKFISSGWVEADLTTTNWETSKTDIGTGKVGMMFLGTWAIGQMQEKSPNKDDIGFAAIPTDDSGKLAVVAGSDYCLGVSKKSENKKEAADFLFYFIDSNYGDKNGFIPIKKSQTSSNPVIKDFTAGVKLLLPSPGPIGDENDKKDKIANKAAIDFYGGLYVQTVAIAAKKGQADFDKSLADLNAKWAKAKEDLKY